jgi:putative intracellular protease/amidase
MERNDAPISADKPRRIGIFLFDMVEEIDAIGPWEVFAWWTHAYPGDGWEATTFSADGKPVTGDNTLVIHPHHTIDNVPVLDVLVHPGGDGHLEMIEDEAHLEWLREQRSRVPLMTSVCTGSIVFAAAGLLSGRSATSHRNSLEHMKAIDPTIEVDSFTVLTFGRYAPSTQDGARNPSESRRRPRTPLPSRRSAGLPPRITSAIPIASPSGRPATSHRNSLRNGAGRAGAGLN